MIVLGLDGGLGVFSAAALQSGRVLAAVEIPGSRALEEGLAAVSAVLDRAGIKSPQIDRIGVGTGPGSFTGVRIAISYAKALAQGWNRPLAGVGSFDALEWGIEASSMPMLAVVRGRTGVVSVRYRDGRSERRRSGYVRDVVAELGGPPDTPVRAAGDTQDVLAALAERGWSVEPVDRVSSPAAIAVAALAGERDAARSFHEIRADYGELPAARVPNLPGIHGP